MTKELVRIEFRYGTKPRFSEDSEYRSKTITIGIYDTIEEAISEGNKALDTIATKGIPLRRNERFTLFHLFGRPSRIIANNSKGVQYYATIKQLNFSDLSEATGEIIQATEEYRKYIISEQQKDT